MTDDIVWLAARFSVTITTESLSAGTSRERITVHAKVVAENGLTRLTGMRWASGDVNAIVDIRQEAISLAIADVRRQAEAIEEHKGLPL